MKKIIRSIILVSFLIFSSLFMNNIFADQPPDPGGGPGSGDDPVGGGAPIGSGLFVMISLGVAYGSKKVFNARKKILE
ncbi:MAG: hypothetical protein B6D61_12970 [Bacteroidetes bacterium 4484_249]|nr:MAG: hypothetical protein B6D61_12970 [Bacteroidetes bacterium 4484_249]